MDAVNAYKKRREHRIKAQRGREDDQWITMKGTHVLIDDGGQAKGGPDRLKTMVNSGGGYKSRDERKYGSNAKYSKALSGGWDASSKKSKLERDAEKFHKSLESWKDVDFPPDNSEPVDSEEFGKKKMKDDLDRFSRLMHEPDREANKEYSYGSGEERKSEPYESFPYSFRVGGRKYASAEDVKKVKATVSRFMNEAKVGDIYEVGGGVGSAGGSRFQITERSGKPYIGWIDSDGRRKGNPVQMSRSNVEKYISNGAKKIK